MAKPGKKEVGEPVPSSITAKDLSLEKRVSLYQEDFEKFKAEQSEKYGLMIDVELAVNPKGLFPRMVLVDLMKQPQQNGDQNKQG